MSSSSGAEDEGPTRRKSARLAAEDGRMSSSVALHSPQHEMHRAIEHSSRNSDFEEVQKLLDKGEVFCRGEGLNCFVLAARCCLRKEFSHRWDLLMKMLQVDPRGVQVRNKDGKTLLDYFCRDWSDVEKMEPLVKMGADLNNVDNAGRTLFQRLFSSDMFDETLEVDSHCILGQFIVETWYFLLEYKEVQNQIIKSGFFDELVLQAKDNSQRRLWCCDVIELGLMSVEELTAKLQMHPLFFIIQFYCGESLRLLIYILKDRKENVAAIVADLNIVDSNGKSVLECFLCPDQVLRYKYNDAEFAYEIWEILIQHSEIQNQASKDGFFRSLAPLARKSSLVRDIFFSAFQLGTWSVEKFTSELRMHPLFFIIQQKCEESLQLLINIWKDDPDKKDHVSALGADLNIVDRNGKSLVECLFDSDVVMNYESHFLKPNVLELWNLLIKRKEIWSQASKVGFFRSLVLFEDASSIVRQILLSGIQRGIWSVEKLTLELQMHPLVFALEIARGKPSKLLGVMKSNPSFFEKKGTIIIKKYIYDLYNDGGENWEKVKDLLNIPDKLALDVFGYILLTLKLSYNDRNYNQDEELAQCLTTLLQYGFTPLQDIFIVGPSMKAEGVVHPIHALLYNIFTKAKKTQGGGSPLEKNLPNVIQQTMTIFKDFPVPHKLVHDPETGTLMLDLHLLMSSMLNPFLMSGQQNPLELIMALMQLSPLHPLQHFATFYKYSSCYFLDSQQGSFLETFCILLRLTLEASDKHKFQGVDQQTIQCISSFSESVKTYQYIREPEEISLHRKAAVKVDREVSSLQWLSILQVRKTLFQRRSSTTVTLPSLIRGLVADKRLPKGLEADLLVYKPNSCINF